MRKVFLTFAVFALAFYSASLHHVSAEDATDESTVTPKKTMYQDKMRKEDSNLKMKIMNEANDAMKAKRTEMLEDKDAFKEEMKAKREEAMERFKARREEFKEQIKTIKDEKKKEVVENIDEKINEMNKNHTDRLGTALSRMNEILTKIKEKAAGLKEDGKDTTGLDKAIKNAETIMATAQSALTDQAGKEYVIEITSETKLRTDVQPVFQQFKTDIRAVHMKVKAVHDSIIKAARELGKVGKPNEGDSDASPSAKSSETTNTTVTTGEEEEVNADL